MSLAAGCGKTNAAPVAKVVREDVPVVSEWVATLDGYVNAQIQAQVAGYVVAQKYKEGSLVRKPFFSAAQLPKFGKHGLVQ